MQELLKKSENNAIDSAARSSEQIDRLQKELAGQVLETKRWRDQVDTLSLKVIAASKANHENTQSLPKSGYCFNLHLYCGHSLMQNSRSLNHPFKKLEKLF